MSKFTPGPWKITDHNRAGDTYIGSDEIAHIAIIPPSSPFAPDQQANARLIAAAPELLEYSEKAVHLFEQLATALIAEGLTHIIDNLKDEHGGNKHGEDSTIDKLRQIIAKTQ